MVLLHTETCKKKEKLEKNYLHMYLTIFLNIITHDNIIFIHSHLYTK